MRPRVRVHGDQFITEPAPGPALAGRSVDQVLAAASESAAAAGLSAGDRMMSSLPWSTPDEVVANLLAVFATGRVAGSGGQSRPDRTGAARTDGEGHPSALTHSDDGGDVAKAMVQTRRSVAGQPIQRTTVIEQRLGDQRGAVRQSGPTCRTTQSQPPSLEIRPRRADRVRTSRRTP